MTFSRPLLDGLIGGRGLREADDSRVVHERWKEQVKRGSGSERWSWLSLNCEHRRVHGVGWR